MSRRTIIALIQGGTTFVATWLLAMSTGFPWPLLAGYVAGLFVVVMHEASQDIASALRRQ